MVFFSHNDRLAAVELSLYLGPQDSNALVKIGAVALEAKPDNPRETRREAVVNSRPPTKSSWALRLCLRALVADPWMGPFESL